MRNQELVTDKADAQDTIDSSRLAPMSRRLLEHLGQRGLETFSRPRLLLVAEDRQVLKLGLAVQQM